MTKQKIIISILMSLLLISCSQATKKTTAKLKLNLSGIINLANGVGNGGAILFGKSATGEQFGKVVSANEQDIELPNGDWSFYAVMWENTTSSGNFKDAVYCGKSAQKLTGTAATVSMTLSNSICTDADFSNGSHYLETKNKFPNLYIEECDELSKSNSFTCLRDNQGSAVSYRMAFKSYTKTPSGAIAYTGDVAFSACKATQGTMGMYKTGTGLNFPTSHQSMPFMISVEMFLGSPDCGVVTPELKGMYTHTFENGIATDSSAINKMAESTTPTCSYGPGNAVACENYLGIWNTTTCSLDATMGLFLPVGECIGGSSTFVSKSLKQMVSIPKDFLCRNTNFNLTGSDVFPGGDGSIARPYKICSEWQLNQIGEMYAANSVLNSKSFKLMNDLDMNNADFNVVARPSCVGVTNSIYKKHHNLNPIGQVSVGGCLTATTATAYLGTFNGNNKTISHGRINANASDMGFVRHLGSGGVIKNLNFKNLQVEGITNVAGIAGKMGGSGALISNVKIDGGEIDSSGASAGAASGFVANGNKISEVIVRNVNIHGGSAVGGLVGNNNGPIDKSMFRGRINQHNSVDDNVGGLVGYAGTGSVISASFSEGEIDSAAKWTGGISGTNEGQILNSYSNMYIESRYWVSGDPNAFIGGISASNNSGTIASVYFDGIISYKGGGSLVNDAIVAFRATDTLSDCFTSSIATTATCPMKDLRLGNPTELIGNSAWKFDVVGSVPRLSWELEKSTRSCLLAENLASVATQVTAGKGTFLLPVIVCNPTQLKALDATPAGRYVKLGDDINISSWNTGDIIQTFSGVLDGQNNSLFGLVMDNSVNANFGIFANNAGTLSNLKIVGNSFTHDYTGATGILAGVNSGVIKNIFMMGNSLQANSYAGLVTGSNSVGGLVSDVFIKTGLVKADSYMGGITGSNEGNILHASVNVNINHKSGTTSYFKIGGITGYNGVSAKIDQSLFAGNMDFTYATTNSTPTYIGGLAGYNSGQIINSMTKNYSNIRVSNNNSVGGLVGFNNSGASLVKSFSLGKVIYKLSAVTASSKFSSLIGDNYGSVTDAFYLENTSAGYIGQGISSICTQSNIDFTGVSALSAYLTVANPLADLVESVNFPFSGDALRNFIPFSIPTTDFVIDYNNNSTCANGDAFNIYKSYDPAAAGKTIMAMSLPSTFTNFDLAMESSNPGLAVNVDRLIAYYKSQMYGTAPTLTPPIWELEENGDYPRLLQVND